MAIVSIQGPTLKGYTRTTNGNWNWRRPCIQSIKVSTRLNNRKELSLIQQLFRWTKDVEMKVVATWATQRLGSVIYVHCPRHKVDKIKQTPNTRKRKSILIYSQSYPALSKWFKVARQLVLIYWTVKLIKSIQGINTCQDITIPINDLITLYPIIMIK